MVEYSQRTKKDKILFLEDEIKHFEEVRDRYEFSYINKPDEQTFYSALIEVTNKHLKELNIKLQQLKQELQ